MRQLVSVCFLTLLSLCPRAIAQDSSGVAHPLDPLSKDEISATADVLRAAGKISDASRFPTIVLHEPPKAEVLSYKPGAPMRREAFAVVYERASNKTFEAVVDLKGKRVISWTEILGVQPSIMAEEFLLVNAIVHADPQWQEAMRKRGITDFQNVQTDPWSAGNFGFHDEEGKRIARVPSYYRGKSHNAYPRPIEGVVAYVDLNAKKIFKLIDTGVVTVPRAPADLDMASAGRQRTAPKPLEIVQPEGASFEVRGNEVRWQNWRFRYALHPREGLVLYTVGYEDDGRLRSVLYRGSISEMVVPYGDPSENWFFRNAFDAGEYGVGQLAVPLEPQTDFPANARLFNAVFAGPGGSPYQTPRAVTLYERDGGILWKHVDYLTGHNESRRARELVLGYVANVGNYEYGFNWVFHQDGMLEMQVDLTGIMQPKGVETAAVHDHSQESYGHLVAENVSATHHQHFFNFRLDMDIDGTANSVVEMNTEAIPRGPENPYANAFVMKETVFRNEQEAQRQVDMAASRKWKVINPSVRNALGEPVGYVLVPGENSVPYADPTSSVRKRAGFLSAHLWVTPNDPAQMNAAGFYINQSKGGEGLPKWISAKRPIDNQDVVLWYTMGITHIPRPEDWPVMPVHRAGFKLMPSGFFSRNPAMDVPKPEVKDGK